MATLTNAEKPPERRPENVAVVPISTAAFQHRQNQLASLLYLPMELQFLICANLSYGDLQNLGRTNRFYRELINIDFIRACLGSSATDASLRFVCRTCHRYDPVGRRLVWKLSPRVQTRPIEAGAATDDDVTEVEVPPPDQSNPKLPLAAHCADCAVRARQLSPGEYVLMEGGERKVRVCRWCGWPCTSSSSPWNKDMESLPRRNAWQLHPRCAWIYQMVVVGYYVLVCIRSGIALVTFILLWRLFGLETLVFVPSIISLLVMGIILAIIAIRGREIRTYHIVGSLEFTLLALSIPPLHIVVKRLGSEFDPGLIAAETLLVTHLIIRLINVLGNVVLFFEYNVTRSHAPDVPRLHKLLVHPLLSGLVFWTSPMALENLWIGRGKHSRHKSFHRAVGKGWKRFKSSFSDFGLAYSHAA